MRTLTETVSAEYDGERTDTVLRRVMGLSGSLIKELKSYPDGILKNGSHTRTVDSVCAGDVLTVNIRDGESENIVPAKMPLDVMYEDEDILILNKPAGVPTHPSPGHYTDTVANGIVYHYLQNGETHKFRPVNRLDADTSGVMCIAKNSFANTRLVGEISRHELCRSYTAIVEGELCGSRVIDAPIARVDFIKRAVRADGQRAVTHCRTVGTAGGYSEVELRLETGRTHQIRVHMAYIGHPLFGDWLYGTEDKALFPRHALHSSYLRLTHPVTGERLEFVPPPAADMEAFWKKCMAEKI